MALLSLEQEECPLITLKKGGVVGKTNKDYSGNGLECSRTTIVLR
jgi:hypothetical protein